MAFKKVNVSNDAIQIKKGTVITGQWVGVQAIATVNKGKVNYIYSFRQKDKNIIDCFGNGSLNYALMNEGHPNEALWGMLLRVTGRDKKKLAPGQNPAQLVDVEVDDSVKRVTTGLVVNLTPRGGKNKSKNVKKKLANRKRA